MAGSWEIVNQRKVLVAVLHTGVVPTGWALGLLRLQIPGHVQLFEGAPYDHARNAACELALQHDFTHVFMFDSDVIAPPDTILRLLQHDLDIVSGMYCRRSPPHGVAVAIKDGQWVHRLPGPGQSPLIEVDLVGAGCLLLSRRFLEKIPPQRPGKRWFDWRNDLAGTLPPELPCMSEDFTLMHHARRHGYKVILDTSIQCVHVGLSQVTFGKMEPMNHQG